MGTQFFFVYVNQANGSHAPYPGTRVEATDAAAAAQMVASGVGGGAIVVVVPASALSFFSPGLAPIAPPSYV
jgi:DNA-binding transcriptional LysR family regulator